MLALQRSQRLATWASFAVAAVVGIATVVSTRGVERTMRSKGEDHYPPREWKWSATRFLSLSSAAT